MTRTYSYDLADPIGRSARLGLIVLQADETLEQDMRRIFPDQEVAVYVSRVPSGADVTTETLSEMEGHLTTAASLLPGANGFDAVGYGCTSGTSVIGADAVAQQIRSGCTTRHVTNPLTALVAACRALGVSRIAFLSPYIEEVSSHMRRALADDGINCTPFGSFNEASEASVARISESSLISAALDLGADPKAGAVFLSCTNLRSLDVIANLEDRLDKPVLSSNSVLAWHLQQLSGARAQLPGRLGAL